MTFISSRYIFMKYPAEQTSKTLANLPRGKPCPNQEFNNRSANLSPVKLAYTSHESTAGNKLSANASPVIIMHGLLGSRSNWNSFSRKINERTGRKVIATDARNHGDSPHAPESSYLHMAEDVASLVEDLGNEKAIVMGHSLGGKTMMYLALNHSEVVEKLVVVDISPISSSPRVKPIATFFDAMENVTLDENISLSEARRMADEQLSAVIKTAAIRENLMQNLVEAEPGKYKWRVNLPVLKKNFETFCSFPHIENRTFNGPTLFVGGGRSDHLPLSDHKKIKELFPAAKIQYIPEAGHWPQAQQPEELLNIIVSFIDEIK